MRRWVAFLLLVTVPLWTAGAPARAQRGQPPPDEVAAPARAIADFEREYVRHLLLQSGGNVSLAARLAGKERSRFNRLVRKYQFSARDFRAPSRSQGS